MKKLNYSEKSHAKDLGAKKGHGNPDNNHSSRGGSTVKHPQRATSGLMGFAAGQRVPMEMFQNTYKKPDYHGMPKVVDANDVRRGTKRALGGAQKKFFGL